MEATTLILDSTWAPVQRVPWERAISLLFSEKVEVIEPGNKIIHSASQEWRVPSVIRWIKMATHRKKAIRFSRDSVFARDRGCCQYCGSRVPRNDFTYDHVIPRSQGGKTVWENVVVCCADCNGRKGSRTPQEAKMHLLTTPVKPKKLSEAFKIQLEWNPEMPSEWLPFLRNSLYWRDDLKP